MSSLGRDILLAEQGTGGGSFDQTGIDFVAVEAADQKQVYVYFVIDPLHPDLGLDAADFDVTCEGVRTRQPAIVTAQTITAHTDAQGRIRNVLALTFESAASFETQRLQLSDLAGDRIDPFSAAALFSFKQACPTVFDCQCRGRPDDAPLSDYPVDYLARDFSSFLDSFATFSRARYPDWQMNIVPDQAAMLGDVIAAIGDELAYIQDGYRLETQFEQLTERRSFAQLTRILGYRLRPELPAQGWVVLRHYDGSLRPAGLAAAARTVRAGTALAGYGDGDMVIPFEVGESFRDILGGSDYPTNARWTDNPAHVPDETCPWLAKGAREIFAAGTDLVDAAIGPGTHILIDTRPTDQAEPLRRHLVILDERPEAVDDDLLGTTVTRLHWRAEDALPYDLNLQHAFVSANIVPVTSGVTWEENFSIGEVPAGLPTAIEREGPLSATDGTRGIVYRYPMPQTAVDGLSWRPGEDDVAWDRRFVPDVALTRSTGGVPETWEILTDLMDADATTEAATVESGHWGPVFGWEDAGQRKQHRDYIGDPGWCLRFGANGFGLTPADGSIFTLRYRTAWAAYANLPPDRMRLLADPATNAPFSLAMPSEIRSIWNPFAFDNAAPPEPLPIAKLTVPHAARAIKRRAVRDSDYEELLTARPDVHAAIARTYDLNTWLGTFVAVDPVDSLVPSDEERAEITRYLEEIRLVGRPAYLAEAALRPLDLQVVLCHDPRTPWGHVVDRTIEVLAGPTQDALFHPANLSFGGRLHRADIETRIAGVPGVTRILRLRYRWRGERDFRDFTESFLDSAPDQIPVLKHDPDRPDLGRIEVFSHALPESSAP